MDVYLHNNIVIMFFFFILFAVEKKRGRVDFGVVETFRGRKEIIQFLLFAIPVVASIYKTYLLGFVPVTTITISSLLEPFCVWVLATIFLKEIFRSSYLKYGMIAMAGFIMVNFQKLSGGGWSFGYLPYLLSYVLVLSTGQITMRYYCRVRKNSLQAIMAEIGIFFIYAIFLLVGRGTFSLSLLFNPFCWLVAICSFLRHILLIHGVRKASSVVALEFCAFSKPIFACLLAFLFFGEIPTMIKVVGMLIIGASLVKFHNLERKYKQERKAIGQKLFDEKTIEKVQDSNLAVK